MRFTGVAADDKRTSFQRLVWMIARDVSIYQDSPRVNDTFVADWYSPNIALKRDHILRGDYNISAKSASRFISFKEDEETIIRIERKAAVICNHRQINPVLRAKLIKSWNTILNALANHSEFKRKHNLSSSKDGSIDRQKIEDALEKECVSKGALPTNLKNLLNQLIREVTLTAGDVLCLPVKFVVAEDEMTKKTEQTFITCFRSSVVEKETLHLSAFEGLIFESVIVCRYTENVTFASYFYCNAVYRARKRVKSRKMTDRRVLEIDNSWQSQLALFILDSDFSNGAAFAAFYEPSVQYGSLHFDSSIVPKLDVRHLSRQCTLDSHDDEGVPETCSPDKSKIALTPMTGTESAVSANFETDAYSSESDTLMDAKETLPENVCSKKRSGGMKSNESEQILSFRPNLKKQVAHPHEIISYWDRMNVKKTNTVPLHFMPIFLVFPFKNYHFISPNGKIHHIDFGPVQRSCVHHIMTLIHQASEIEVAVRSASRLLTIEDAIEYALCSQNILDQGSALLVIRDKIGDTLFLDGHTIHLPYLNEVEVWRTHFYKFDGNCTSIDRTRVILPKGISTGSVSNEFSKSEVKKHVSLIRELASASASKLNASMICASYYLPEYLYRDVYEIICEEDDARLYVFFTLILQSHNLWIYREFRDSLSPVFSSSFENQAEEKKSSRLMEEMIGVRTQQVPDVEPQNFGSNGSDCLTPPLRYEGRCSVFDHIEMYEFTNPQLNALVASGDTPLSNDQKASLVALLLRFRTSE